MKSKNQRQKGEAIVKRKAAERKKSFPPPLKKRNGSREIQKSAAKRGSYRKKKSGRKENKSPVAAKKREGGAVKLKISRKKGSYRQKKSGRKEKSLPPPLKPIRKHHKTYDSRQVNGKTKNAMQKVRRSHSIFCSAFRRNAQPLPTQ